ncbi:hypothetical protein QP028_14635 [Corynebacterium suedekumii]|nr:hypothetical protein QP028_14635 [Corynebacterium suedekumii]
MAARKHSPTWPSRSPSRRKNLLRPAVLRAAVWESTQTTLSPMDLADFLSDHEARAWQLELAMPLLSPLLTPVRG